MSDVLCACGCCEGLAASTPAEVHNRPGLGAVAYRVGTHGRFKRSMLARLSTLGHPSLADLRTRDDDDFAIALLDGWATVADVLTFYQERIANEAFLRTATERLSMVELTRLIGYRPRPPVAASTYLAFALETGPGTPERATIDVGTKVQSLPGPGEKPQTFETVEKLEAHAAWNEIRPRLSCRQPLSTSTGRLLFAGLGTGLRRGDGLLLTPDGGGAPVFRVVAEVTPDTGNQRTEVRLQQLGGGAPSDAAGPGGPIAVPAAVSSAISAVDLRARAYLMRFNTEALFTTLAASQPPPPSVLAFRARASLFGHNAPDWKAMPDSVRRAYGDAELDDPDWPDPSGLIANQIDLDAVYDEMVPGTWVAVVRGGALVAAARVVTAAEQSLTRYTVSGKATQLQLATGGVAVAPTTIGALRSTSVYGQSETLELARSPITDPVSGAAIELDGWVDLAMGQVVVLCGELDQTRGVSACEAATIASVEHVLETEGGGTRIGLRAALGQAYVRDTVRINANVAPATHGETRREVLGSGDGSKPYQRFQLRHPPLTHVSSPLAAGGAESTLRLWVDRVEWEELPDLYGRGPRDHVFVTRTGDHGKTVVQFGDGRAGARLPTGTENVEAEYRQGAGVEGNVRGGQLTLLMTRPLGVRAVTNPIEATDGADGDSLEDARRRAPTTVLTLDRVVSLRDYEDFAIGFAGIAKALATWTWDGQTRGVFVTVAGPAGRAVPSGSETHSNLVAAVRRAGDPTVPVRLRTFRPALFRVLAGVTVATNRRPEDVLAAGEAALRTAFSFERRGFGQGVALSEVVAVIHSVPGVIAVDVDRLHRVGEPEVLNQGLTAAAPRAGDLAAVDAAELLTLDPGPLALVLRP